MSVMLGEKWGPEMPENDDDDRRQMVACGYCGSVLYRRDAVTCHVIHKGKHGPCEMKFCTVYHQEMHRRDMEGE